MLLSGCATSKTIITPTGDTLTSDKLDVKDFSKMAEELVASMIESAVLDNTKNHPAIIVVGNFINTTSVPIDQTLSSKIVVALNRSKKAIVDSTGINSWDFVLTGSIDSAPPVRVKNKTEKIYTLRLKLTDTRGLEMWNEAKEVSKTTTRPGVGR